MKKKPSVQGAGVCTCMRGWVPRVETEKNWTQSLNWNLYGEKETFYPRDRYMHVHKRSGYSKCWNGEKLNSKHKLKFLWFCQAEIPFGAKHPDRDTSNLELCSAGCVLVYFSAYIKQQQRQVLGVLVDLKGGAVQGGCVYAQIAHRLLL